MRMKRKVKTMKMEVRMKMKKEEGGVCFFKCHLLILQREQRRNGRNRPALQERKKKRWKWQAGRQLRISHQLKIASKRRKQQRWKSFNAILQCNFGFIEHQFTDLGKTRRKKNLSLGNKKKKENMYYRFLHSGSTARAIRPKPPDLSRQRLTMITPMKTICSMTLKPSQRSCTVEAKVMKKRMPDGRESTKKTKRETNTRRKK